MYHAISHNKNGFFDSEERRGRYPPPPANKTPPEAELEVKRHIESFPTLESHYARKDSQRKYLPGDLNVAKMYQLYVDQVKAKGKDPVSISVYRHIFNNDFNLAFHMPKKD